MPEALPLRTRGAIDVLTERIENGKRILARHWNEAQSRFMLATPEVAAYVDFEGAVRAGKTTPLVSKIHDYALRYPGIPIAITRWTQDGLDAQLKPRWREVCRLHGTNLTWNADEQFDQLDNGSMVYLRALKASEGTARYGKLAGLTLAILAIDQPEEVPEDVYRAYVPARLSHPDYPHQLLLTPNPPGLDHWIAQEFPIDNSRPGRLYIRTTVYDNREVLGEAYIRSLEEAYPEGTALRSRFIDGRRGLAVVGSPVYQGYFSRKVHERPLALDPEVPLLESWDFGHRHPCVTWHQVLPWGEWRVLGGVMGTDLYIEDFAPAVVGLRAQWFPHALTVWSTGDPAGASENSQGTKLNAERVLQEQDIALRLVPGANHPEKRNYAIQVLAGYMRRASIRGGQSFGVDNARWLVVDASGATKTLFCADGLEAGYVWDERSVATTTSPNTRRPRKDGYYDHSMNTLEYAALSFGPAQPSKVDMQKLERQALARAQKDYDPEDTRRWRQSFGRSRGGY